MEDALGVDIGGVIIARMHAGDTSFHSDNSMQTPAIAGAFEALRRLVDERFGERVFLVSKCGPAIQAETLRWLDHSRFYESTGVQRAHVRFCRERHQKAGICSELSITHFVDDRLEVLGYLEAVNTRYLCFSHALKRGSDSSAIWAT
jgi:hypothetical protein